MKISYNWLKQYVDVDLDPHTVSDILTNIGLEVEGIEAYESIKGGLKGIVIGEVLSCEKHPDADKLTVTTVDVGSEEPVQIVCGAPNVAAGQKVPVATVGTMLYAGEEEFKIKKTKIRGQVSLGMICAEDELGLGDDHEGIMVLDTDLVNGSPASEYFKVEQDTIFEIGLTPNRIDGASHYGVARDLAAYLKQNGGAVLCKPDVDPFTIDTTDLHIDIEIEESAGCKRYSGITISDVDVKESPDWLKNRLRSIGQTPINNIVDITNFVLHEVGQPLHAFDADKLAGQKVIVKTLPEGTKFVTLDEKERELLGSDLMICDAESPLCIAGVFGGISSGVTFQTRNVFLESACFDPVYIRKSSKHHILNTDAAFRFERGSDPNGTVWALKRAIHLIKELAGGLVSSEIIDVYPEPVEHFKVDVSYKNITRLIGKAIEPDTIQSILESLDIEVKDRSSDGLKLEVPPYRVDVQRESDVIEEILRIYGFNNVEIDEHVNSTLSYIKKPDKEKIINQVSDLLSANGFNEIKANSLTKASYYKDGEVDDPTVVKIYNPLSQDLSRMRKTLIFGGLEALAYNINRKSADLKLYEFGYTYETDPDKKSDDPLDKYSETHRLGIFISGNTSEGNWMEKGSPSSFYYLKTYVEMVLNKLGIDSMIRDSKQSDGKTFSEGLVYLSGPNPVVEFGKVSSHFLKATDISQDVFAAEFDWDRILKLATKSQILFQPLPKYPSVNRDLSMMLDREVTYEQLRILAFKTEKQLLKRVTLFDVYDGDKIDKGKKSYALSFTLQDEHKTLTDKQIDKVMDRLATAFENAYGAVIRRG